MTLAPVCPTCSRLTDYTGCPVCNASRSDAAAYLDWEAERRAQQGHAIREAQAAWECNRRQLAARPWFDDAAVPRTPVEAVTHGLITALALVMVIGAMVMI